MLNLRLKLAEIRIPALVAVVGLCFLIAVSSVSAQKRRSQAEVAPLVLQVTTATPTICLGTKNILLKAVMTNVSKQPVTIDKYFLWKNSISVTFENKTGGSGELAFGESIHGAGDFLEIAPKQKYKEFYKFSFISNDVTRNFFRHTGQYILNIIYQAADLNNKSPEVRKRLYTKPVISNQITFRIIKCP